MKTIIRPSKGFTLIEVLLALGAMMVGVIALWGLHMSALKVDLRNNSETRAIFWNERMLEQLRSLAMTNFANPALANGNDVPEAPFQRNWIVANVSNWRKDVTVIVTWPEQVRMSTGGSANVTRTVQMSTILVNLTVN